MKPKILKFNNAKLEVAYKILSYSDEMWETRKGEQGVFSVELNGLFDCPYTIFIWGDVKNGIPNRSYRYKTLKDIDAKLKTVVAKLSKEKGEEIVKFYQNKIDKIKEKYEIT
jgi:hypothetical protein